MGEKTVAQLQAEWVNHGNIAKLQHLLDSEPLESKRKPLEEALAQLRGKHAPTL